MQRGNPQMSSELSGVNTSRLIITADGSHSIQVGETTDTYHSTHGAVQESQHVFIKNGLQYFLETYSKNEIKILEVGFGTGLNALLTLQGFSDSQIEYTTLEPFPITEEIFLKLNYAEKENLLNLHKSDWNVPQKITQNFILKKLQTTLEQAKLSDNYFDVIYFDAFAPNSQPELWTPRTFEKVFKSMTSQSVFTTYCAKGQVKRDLKSTGFQVQSLPGPPGKREMIRALK